jgi:hypothetical protein
VLSCLRRPHETAPGRKQVSMSHSLFIPTVVQVDGKFEASCKARNVVCVGETADEALGALVKYYCDLGRRGCIDPSNPEALGNGAIQHVLSVLTEELTRVIETRRDIQFDATRVSDMRFYSEHVTALGTAIAAVGRVKDAPSSSFFAR